ncbi:MAG: sugar transferase [Sphingobacteriaceae bacterium]|nr:MAG: sugar transferase [Sphingobacteriaceae bacterium]
MKFKPFRNIQSKHEDLHMNNFIPDYQTDFKARKVIIENTLYTKIPQLKAKRLADIMLSLLLIFLLLPVFITVAILIKISSKGSVFYTNKRIGLFGAHFHCLKFRSMVTEQSYSKADQQAYEEAKQQGLLFKPMQDSRVTRIGKIIRKTSIDELPQLFNVLNGDMSIVGPRPLVPFMLDNLEEFNQIRSLLKPGITGKWQIENRTNNTSATYMIKPDVHYIEFFSLVTDLKILLKTPKAVLNAGGAY